MYRDAEQEYTVPMTPADILSTSHRLVMTPYGWLAVSADDQPFRIGVVGESESAVVEQFDQALQAWARLRELPDPYVS